MIGGLGLGTLSAIQSYIEEARCPSQNPPGGWKIKDCGSPEGTAAVVFMFTGALGAAVGTLVGVLIQTDRWESVPQHVRGAVLPSGKGAVLTLSVYR
jgi:hypothetical protein